MGSTFFWDSSTLLLSMLGNSSCPWLINHVCCIFIENIPHQISPKSGFESFADYTQRVIGGSVHLEATQDISAGEEVYVRHAPGDIQSHCGSASTQSTAPVVSASTSCFHCSCNKVMFALFPCFCTCSESVRFSPLCAMRSVLEGHPHCLYRQLRQF